MFEVVLYRPEIPPNTGNVIRLCANAGARLHLIQPLGFALDDARLKRAGLDYHEYATLQLHESWESCLNTLHDKRFFTVSTRGLRRYDQNLYRPGDVFVFGPETRGLPGPVLSAVPEPQRIRLPMRPDNRSLNLSNAVAVVVYEAWRQIDFAGAAQT